MGATEGKVSAQAATATQTACTGKPPVHLLPWGVLPAISAVMGDASATGKHKVGSWITDSTESHVASLGRHYAALYDSGTLDPTACDKDSGLPHAYHIAIRSLMLAYHVMKGVERRHNLDKLTQMSQDVGGYGEIG